jgi:IS30 family transposase
MKKKTSVRGQSHPRAKLSEQDVREIKALAKVNASTSKIASIYGVSQPTVSQIKTGRIWTHIR